MSERRPNNRPFRDQSKHNNGFFMMRLIHEEHQDGNSEMIRGKGDIVAAASWYTSVVHVSVAVTVAVLTRLLFRNE